MKVVYDGPFPSVTTQAGDVFPKGEAIEVDAKRGKRLVEQPDFSVADTSAKPTTTDKEES